MKKQPRKMPLKFETVRMLLVPQLTDIKGGRYPTEGPTGQNNDCCASST